ncbi:uncharacterized protein LOC127104267 [Lathyrus oleraceus]|uniref:uncharacterized protein LOC127104267 n=1 Tax=Pisum sativum TaxID=3888 RepID=UPI0021CE0D29|nr:uncharacterized protein LOC127104267 [Pisum sativum]
MYLSPEVEQHSEKNDDSSSSEKDMAAKGLCSLGQTVSGKGKFVASKTANASHSEKHDVANDAIDLEDDRSDDQEDNLLHHLKSSVAKRMKNRKGRFVAELMSARTTKKVAGVGPSKSWSKVEVKKRMVREVSEYEEDVEEDVPDISPVKKTPVKKSHVKVVAVHLDNISFHLEDGAAKWKFVIQRRVVVERELGKDDVEVKEVMELIKTVGLMKTMFGFSQCYEGLVKEFIVNIPEDIADKNSKEFCKVFVTVKLPIAFPSMICGIILNQHPGILSSNDLPSRRKPALSMHYKSFEGSHVEVIVMTSAMKKPTSKVGTIAELNETCKELGEGIRVATARKESIGQALGGHKTCHRSNKQQIHDDKAHKTIKITFFLSSSPIYPNNHDAKLKRHSWTRVFKGTVHHPPAALKPLQQEELPAVDLVSLLPPRSYNTKKKSRRYLIHDGVSNNTAPIPLLDMSREVANLDLNRSEYKRMKISSNGNETEMTQKPFVPLTSDGIDETVGKEEKNLSEGETAESRVVGNFDLNELQMHDVETGVSRVVRDFDLNELPTNDIEKE